MLQEGKKDNSWTPQMSPGGHQRLNEYVLLAFGGYRGARKLYDPSFLFAYSIAWKMKGNRKFNSYPSYTFPGSLKGHLGLPEGKILII